MDKTSSVIAALDAGKLPSHRQLNAIIDWSLLNIIPSDSPELTQSGRAIARGLADVLTAYKQFGANKNYDNLVQDTLWHLSEGDLSATRIEAIDVKEASADMDALRAALRNLLKTLWANISGEGSHLLNDFASFMRLALADFAEALEAQAAHTKQTLRESESEVQRGERGPLGRKLKTPEEEREEVDPKVKFEKTMGMVTEVGSKAIGAGQSIKDTAEEKTSRTRIRLTEAFYQVCDRAQSDKEYKSALSTLFDIASKWLNRTLDTATTADEVTSLSNFIDDPTEGKHVHHALINIRTLCERLAGGKSLDDLCAKLRACALDIKQDKDLKAWFDDFITHVRSGLESSNYARSQDAHANREQLERRWKELLDNDSGVAKKWRIDLESFRRELREFQQAIANDADLRYTRQAHARFVLALERSVVAGGRLGLQFASEQASWFWQDLFNVYTQRILGVLKNIPIPRIEYVDREVEFVLENLDISSFNLLPGHAYVRNITDIEITAPGESRASTKTAFGTLTHTRLQAIQLSLRDVSFFYRDKASIVGPNDFSGIMQFNLPTQGLDVDFKFRLIPNTQEGLAERERCKRFFKIERVDVKLADDIKFDIKESNHPTIASVFKPVLVHRFRDAIERTLEEHIRGVFDFTDAIAFDISKRSEVFADTGLGPAASLAAATWSEVGHLRKLEGGVLTGWKATSTGIVKEGREGEPTIALGAEPQILPGEKRGPLGYSSEPLAERIPGIEVPALPREGKVAERVKEVGQEGLKRVQTFKETVQHKVAKEKKCVGWESVAFDLV
ncbi:hypothetical protein J3R83DRAFT_11772 [Lanmaoa asiatica]|nr:hypothetical protein J3R83DRAFT_11772 [Lanmaoa asiatica]